MNNRKWLFKFAQDLGLMEFASSFDKILTIINREEYLIKTNPYFNKREIKTFLHYRSGDCSCKERYIYINPDIKEHLYDDKINFIWGLLHEIGHILTIGIRTGDCEMREVIAWDMAQHLINCELPELKSKQDSFEKRVIYTLQKYWESPKSNWDNKYQWITNKNGDRLLERKSK